jgi:hypothetical protein
MTYKTAPKLVPTFSLLIAGTGVNRSDKPTSLNSAIEEQLTDLVATIVSRLKLEVAAADLIYGVDADAKTVLNILSGHYSATTSWASIIADHLHLSLHVVHCGDIESSNITATSSIERMISLSSVVASDVYLSQEQLVQEGTLRAFSDILLWIGDALDDQSNHKVRLLRDTILEGKTVIWLHSDNKYSLTVRRFFCLLPQI